MQKQQLEFAELQLREAGAQLAETRRAHERATAALQDKESEQAAGEHEAQQRLSESVERHALELAQIRAEHDAARERLSAQLR